MSFPPEVVKSVAVYHLPTSGSKTYPGSADTTISGAFLPLDRKEHALEGGAFRNPHELYVDSTADVRESDKLVIDGTTYFVKQIFNAPIGGLPHKRCTISTE